MLISNAALQRVPQHTDLLRRWAGELDDGGWIAVQVPANVDAPSHALMRELADSPRWRVRLDGVLRDVTAVAQPETYLDLLTASGLHADVWQTRYLHVLAGDDPVLEQVAGTGLRPVLQALEDRGRRVHRRARRRAAPGVPAASLRDRLPLPAHLRRRPRAVTVRSS